MTFSNDIWGIVLIIAFAAIAHEPWRWLGAILGRGISETDDVFVWVRYVSAALVAALSVRLVLFPAGVLDGVALPVRLLAMAIATGVFLATGRNLALGIIAGGLSLMIMSLVVHG